MSKKKKTAPPPETPSRTNQWVLAAPFLAVILLILAGALMPGRLTWGTGFLSIAGPTAAVIVVILAVIAATPPVAAGLAALLSPLICRLTRLLAKINRPVLVVIASLAATLLLFYWRSRSFVYGDGYILLSDASSGENLTLASTHYLKILTVYLNHYAYDLFSSFSGWSAAEVVGLSNSVGGMFGLWAVYRLCCQLSNDIATRAFVFLGSLSSASVVLFFGYIENYTWALSLGLWTLSFSIGYSRKQNGAAILLMTAGLSALLHLINLAFVAVALMALILKERPEGNYNLKARLRYVNLGLIFGSFLLVGLAHSIDLTFFVPFLSRDGNPYSLLAVNHVIDVLNQIALAAPLGAAMVILTLTYFRDRQAPGSVETGLLGTSGLLLFLAAVWIDPELGAPRDWDLLSFYGLPLTIWGLYRFTRYFPDGRVAQRWLVVAGVVAGITLIPHLYEKNHPDLAVARLDALIFMDPHYQVTYDEAARCVPWAVVLQKGYGNWELAIRHLKRRISAKPDAHAAHFNLADSYYFMGILDSAYMCMRQGLRLKADEVQKLVNASAIAKQLGNYRDAVTWAQEAVRKEPANVSALTQLGVSLTYAKKSGEALTYLRRAFNLAPQTYDCIVNMGMAHAMTGTVDSAYYYYVNALAVSPDDRKVDIYFCLVSLCIDFDRLDEAAHYLNALRRIDPTSPDFLQLNAKLAEALKR